MKSHKNQALFLLIAWIISLIWSMEAVTSISMIGLWVIGLWEFQLGNGFPIVWRKTIGPRWSQFLRRPDYLVLMVPFFLVLLTATYSSDIPYTLERLRIKLPFLILPFAFFLIPRFTRRDYYLLLLAFVVTMTSAVIWVGFDYWENYSAFNKLLSQGRAIPTPVNHIRFSLMLAFAIISGGYLFIKKYYLKFSWERGLLLGVTIFLAIMLHMLSVKSGILALYLAIGYLVGQYIWTSRNFLFGGVLALLLVTTPVIGYLSFPSLQIKIGYMLYDLDMFWQGKGHQASDGQRIVSLQNGWRVVKEHPIIGVGAGDVKQATEAAYHLYTPGFRPIRPHNQYLTMLVGTGIIGLALFVASLVLLFFYQKHYRHPLFAATMVILLFSFMVENTIENAVGVAFFCLVVLINLKGIETENTVTSEA